VMGLGQFTWRRAISTLTLAGKRYWCATSTRMRRAAGLPALVIAPPALAAGVLRLHQPQVGHELAGVGKALEVLDLDHQRGRGDQPEPAQRMQRGDYWQQRPLWQRVTQRLLQPLGARAGLRDRVQVLLERDLLARACYALWPCTGGSGPILAG
jgi:hypothetical protein